MKFISQLRFFETLKLTGLLLAVPLLLTNCGSKNNSNTSGIQPTFTSIYTNILSKNCVQCHEPQGSATQVSGTQIDFSNKSSAYQTLTSGTTSGDTAILSGQCTNVPLVHASHPESSYLMATLATDYHHSDFYKPGCTPYSPSGHGATIDSTEKDAIVDWIKNGALNN